METYGCQMNVADSEVVAAVLDNCGYAPCDSPDLADAVFINTCSIRDNAEKRVVSRLQFFNTLKKKNPKLIVGVLGCMAERVKEKLVTEYGVGVVAGPDSDRGLPNPVGAAEWGEEGVCIEPSAT